ncbi:DUF4345 domain-containing protein [Myxococcaceae bacterium GXIMD 01537]
MRGEVHHVQSPAHRADQSLPRGRNRPVWRDAAIAAWQPETTPRLDNVHRFMAGVYLSMGVISFWVARTIRQQGTLVYLIAFSVFMAAVGRLLSISTVGMPEPAGAWLAYLLPELVFPVIIAGANWLSQRQASLAEPAIR